MRIESTPAIQRAKYLGAALALKAFGATRPGAVAYRAVGNRLMAGRHSSVDMTAISRGQWVWQEVGERIGHGLRPPRVLELGTGWTHYYGLFLRLAYPVRLVLFDVVDNRSLMALRSRFAATANLLRVACSGDPRLDDALPLAERISKVGSLGELYRLVGATYVLDPSGEFGKSAGAQFDCVLSLDVLEHVQASRVGTCIDGISRALVDGGVSAHQIGLNDHLNNYATGMPSKNYLKYGEASWRLVFGNALQYINRLQAPDYRSLFERHGFTPAVESAEYDWRLLDMIRPAPRYESLSVDDLCTTRLSMVHRRD